MATDTNDSVSAAPAAGPYAWLGARLSGENNFDAVRLFAALQVAILHAANHLEVALPRALDTVLRLWPGVPIFFFVSGCLVASSLASSSSMRRYAIARFKRVFPPLWVALGLALLLLIAFGQIGRAELEDWRLWAWLISQIGPFQLYNPPFFRDFGVGVVNGSLWTIPVEVAFYVLLPVLCVLAARHHSNGRAAFVGLIAVGSVLSFLIHLAALAHGGTLGRAVSLTLAAHFWLFGAGVLTYLYLDPVKRILAVIPYAGVTLPALHVAMGLLIVQAVPAWLASATVSFSLLPAVLGVAFGLPVIFRSLRNFDMSYGLYLFHMLVVNLFVALAWKGTTGALVAAVGTSIVVAALSWHLLERHILVRTAPTSVRRSRLRDTRSASAQVSALVLAVALHLGVAPSAQAETGPLVDVHMVETPDQLVSVSRLRLRPGDVVVVSPMRTEPKLSWQTALTSESAEPVTIVGRGVFDAVLSRRGLSRDDVRHRRDVRAALSEQTRPLDLPAQPSPDLTPPRLAPDHPVDHATLTALRAQQFRFLNGNWILVGFDLAAVTDQRTLILVEPSASLRITGNRLSNCSPGFTECLWTGQTADGRKRNGGIIAHFGGVAPGSAFSGNLIEHIEAFIIVSASNASRGLVVAGNVFRHARRYGDGTAQPFHIGVVPIVRSPLEEPLIEATEVRIVNNLFVDYSADHQLIGIKSAGNVISGNHIYDSASGISLRDGADTRIERNVIVRSLGIRVMGDRQIVRDNIIVLPVNGHGIWFENGARRAGHQCAFTINPDGTKTGRRTEPLRWIYRHARAPVVEGNIVHVAAGQTHLAIAPRTLDKPCGFVECDGRPESIIPCDAQFISSQDGNTIGVHPADKTP